MSEHDGITNAQRGMGDMDPAEFRAAAHRVADLAADYLENLEQYRVLPDVKPGDTLDALPDEAPAEPEPLPTILEDYLRLIQPNITHWQHPGFLAYFSSVASGPGILGEWLAALLNSNVMFWRNAPASTELELQVVRWLRDMMGLPSCFDGMLTDTASVSSLLSVVAARHAVPGLEARDRGLSGRPGSARLRMYCSREAHYSIEKAAIVAGIGREGVRRVPVDAEYRMLPDELARAVTADRRNGYLPFCVAATLGTTSSTSMDPAAAIADVCGAEGLWLHVDAAYAGAAALDRRYRPLFRGWERAQSIVVNPHKWMFTPFDASLLLYRDPDHFRDAFSLVPEYIRTPDTGAIPNFNEYGIQMGRRFRALKLWILIRYFGARGMAERIHHHCEMARELARAIEDEPGWELLAPVPFSTVCLRHVPDRLAGRDDDDTARKIDAHNEAILDRVNDSGEIFLSHTKLLGRYTIRVSIGNPRTTRDHVRRCWGLLRKAARA